MNFEATWGFYEITWGYALHSPKETSFKCVNSSANFVSSPMNPKLRSDCSPYGLNLMILSTTVDKALPRQQNDEKRFGKKALLPTCMNIDDFSFVLLLPSPIMVRSYNLAALVKSEMGGKAWCQKCCSFQPQNK